MFIPLHDANYLRHIRLQYVTLAVIVANCAIWLVMAASGVGAADNPASQATFFSYGFIPAVANGYENLGPDLSVLPEPATYVTYAFLHGNFMHLAGNMLFIWVFGDNVEDATGHVRFVIFFLACAVAGALMHSLIQPQSTSPLIGASGAAAGIIAAYLMLHPRVKVWVLALGRIPLRLSAMWVISAWIAFQVINLLIAGDDQVSWGAHVGGIIAGVILLPLLKRRDVPLFDTSPVEETIPPVAPPSVSEDEHRASTDPVGDDDAAIPASQDQPADRGKPMPWGRQPR